MKELLRGAETQARVVYAVILRETRTRFGRNQLGYLWALLEPIFWIATFWGMFLIVDRRMPNGMEAMPFLATGIVPYELVIKTSDRASGSVEANRALLFYPHVQPLDLIVARSLLEIATYGLVFTVLLGFWALVSGELNVDDVLRTMQGLGLAGLLGMSLGTVLCAGSTYSKAVDRIRGPIMRPLFWVSGIFFTANAIPLSYREYFLWNPILHCTEMVRDGWFPGYHAQDASPTYVMLWIIALAFCGLTLERNVRTKIELS